MAQVHRIAPFEDGRVRLHVMPDELATECLTGFTDEDIEIIHTEIQSWWNRCKPNLQSMKFAILLSGDSYAKKEVRNKGPCF